MSTRRAIVRRGRARPDDLAVEDPLVLGLEGPGLPAGGEVLATVMRTPGHDLELAAGWLCVETAGHPRERGEGVRRPEDLVTLRACRDHDTDRVLARLRDGVATPRARAFVTSSACGVCSADVVDLAGLRGTPHQEGWRVSGEVVIGLPEALRARQRVFARTGGLHAAALATASGAVYRVFEDVGRHNAVDKAVGRALLDGALPATDRLLVVSGRVSFELVQKAMAAGVAGLVAVSAPSSLAVDLAREHGLLLAGMVRDGGFNLYAGEELVV